MELQENKYKNDGECYSYGQEHWYCIQRLTETTVYGTVSYVTAGLAPALRTTADKTLVLETVSMRRPAQNLFVLHHL